MNMTAGLHFGGGNTLLFETWRPSSNGAIAGASVGIFVFGVLERILAAWRRSLERQWRARALLLVSKHQPSNPISPSSRPEPDEAKSSSIGQGVEEESDHPGSMRSVSQSRVRDIPPFIFSHDIPRGMLHALQSTFTYALMLIVMTLNGAYIISVILGLGVGECLFGRVERV